MPYTGSHQPFPRERRPEWHRLNRAFRAVCACANAHEDKLLQGEEDASFAPHVADVLCEVWAGLNAAGLEKEVCSNWKPREDAAEILSRELLLCAPKGARHVEAGVAREAELTNAAFFHAVTAHLCNFGWTLLEATRHRFSTADLPEVISALKRFRRVVEQSPTGSNKPAARAACPALTEAVIPLIAALHPSDPPERANLKPGERILYMGQHNEDLYDPDLPPASALALKAVWKVLSSLLDERGRFPLNPDERIEWLDLIDRTVKTLGERPPGASAFLLERGLWHITFAGESRQFKPEKGFERIHQLLRTSYRSVPALTMTGSDIQRTNASFHDADPADQDQDKAKRLVQQIKNADENLEPELAERLRGELDNLAKQIKTQALSTPRRRGRARQSGPAADAFAAVMRSIRRAYSAMKKKVMADLVRHLVDSIHPDENCSLAYKPSVEPTWTL